MSEQAQAALLPEVGVVTLAELAVSLEQGWQDFRRAPVYGLFFGGFYAVAGMVLTLLGAGSWIWTLVLSLGFPLVAPFAAVGLYEVSRRLEDGTPLDMRGVLGVVLAERYRQIPWAGAIIVIYFLFWSFLAHMLFALFLGPSALMNVSTSWDILWTPAGMRLVAVELVVGGAAAFLLFALTVVSLPLLLEREVDFVSAMLLSLRATLANLRSMLIWAALIAALLFIGMLPYFLGLFVVLPVLGHATWHLYRRALYDPV